MTSGEVRQTFRLGRVALLAVVVVGAALAVGWMSNRYTDPERIRALAEAYLQQLVNGRVTVGSASFSWTDGIRLFDVSVAEVPQGRTVGAAAPAAQSDNSVFSCREVELVPDWGATILGDLTIETVVAIEPTCSIVRDATLGTTNLAALLRQTRDKEPGPTTLLLPTMELRDARVQVIYRDQAGTRTVEDLTLTVRGRLLDRDSRFYDLVWQGGDGRAAQGHSRIDLKTNQIRNISGGLPWMSIEAVMIAVGAEYPAAGTWCDLLGLEGKVRAPDYNLAEASEIDGPRSVTIELNNASLSIPVDEDEVPLPAGERYLRFREVHGTVEITAEGIAAEFSGLFHGGRCTVSATLRGGMERLATLDDVDLDVRLSVEGLELPRVDLQAPPAHARFVKRWSQLSRFFRDYDPHGRVDLEIEATKSAGANEPVLVRRMRLDARDCDTSCRFFPYRVSGVTGSVEFTPGGVFLRDLQGTHGGGAVAVNGRFDKPNRCAAAELEIHATSIPIDRALRDAFPKKYASIDDLFAPRGLFDVDLELHRKPCAEGMPGEWLSTAVVSFDDLAARYAGLPYPVEQLTGKLVLTKGQLQVTDVRGHTGDATIAVNGMVTFGSRAVTGLELSLLGRDIVFDDVLFGSLPDRTRRHVTAFNPIGRFDIDSLLTLDRETRKVEHSSTIGLKGVTIEYDGFPVPIEDLHGNLSVTSGAIKFDGLTGRYGDAAVHARGSIALDGHPRETSVDISCRGLRLDDRFRAVAPARLGPTVADWSIDGPIDAEINLRSGSASPGEGFLLSGIGRVHGATVRHPRFPVALRDVRAEITFDEDGVRASGVRARYDTAAVSIDFDTRKSAEGEETIVSLTATGLTLNESVRDFLPIGARPAWDRLGLAGRVDLYLQRLRYHKPSEDRPRTWLVDGYAELYDVAMPGLCDLRRMSGTLDGGGLLVDRLGGTALNGNLRLATTDLFGRRLTNVQSSWSYALVSDGEARFALDSVRAGIYGGALSAQVEVVSDGEETRYAVSTTVRNMDIEPALLAGRPARAPSTRGLADARLQLSGVVGSPRSKRGSGRVEVTEGHMYRLPIMLAILNVINLSVPDENAFHDLEAEFFVAGNRLEMTEVLLRGNLLALVGSGTISLPDAGLDLDLVNVSPHSWARIPGIARFVEDASRELVELHVTGPLHRPTVRARPLRGISAELQRLFRKREPKRLQAVAP